MPHPPELIEKIKELLVSEYPPAEYQYQIEKAIPGTRYMPDILITSNNGQSIWCAVEIGYTRPEKLWAYRNKLLIADVRWYDKAGHLYADIEEKLVKVNVQFSVSVPDDLVYIYTVQDEVPCSCEADCRWCLDSNKNMSCEGCIYETPYEDVSTWVVTDRVKAFYPSYCDKCGDTFFAHWIEAGNLHFDLDALSPREYAGQYGTPQEVSWDEACQMVSRLELSLDYDCGYFINEDDERRIKTTIRLMREKERAA